MKPITCALVLAGVLGLAACTSSAGQETTGSTLPEETTTSPETTGEAAPEASHRPGEPFTYQDGLQVTATYLGPRPISETACCNQKPGDRDVVFRITVTAGDAAIDPTSLSADLTYGTQGNQAEPIIDTEQGINTIEGPSKLLPHHKVNGLYGFKVPGDQVNHLVLTVTPDFDREPVVYER